MKKLLPNILIIAFFLTGAYYLSLPLITSRLTDKAQALQAEYRYEKAEPLYKQAIKFEAGNAQHQLNLANFYLNTNYYELRPETLGLFVTAGILNPSSADTRIGLSNYFLKLGDLVGAEERIKQAVSLDPNNAGLRLHLCYFYMQNNQLEQSKEQFKKAFVALPAYWSYRLLKDKELSADYVDIAINGLEEHLNTNSASADLFRGLGILYSRKGETEKAISYYKKATQLGNNNAWLHLDLSYAYDRNGDLYQAMEEARVASKIDPANYSAVIRLAKLYEKMEMPVEAKSAYKEAVRLKPKEDKLRIEFIKYLLAHNEIEDAIKESRSAVYTFPANTQILYQLIQAYKTAGKYQLAMIETQRLISIDPSNEKYKEELKNLYALGSKNL